jgi:hypothetical protein
MAPTTLQVLLLFLSEGEREREREKSLYPMGLALEAVNTNRVDVK